jgi:hypothetical protein
MLIIKDLLWGWINENAKDLSKRKTLGHSYYFSECVIDITTPDGCQTRLHGDALGIPLDG